MFRDIEITPEEEEKMIEKVASLIHEYGLDFGGMLLLEMYKPMSFIGSNMGRLFLGPFLPALGLEYGEMGEKYFSIFEKHENWDKLIQKVKKKDQERKLKEKEEKERKRKERGLKPKTGWRRFIPFL
jgi:hypothetical protein